MPAWNALPVLAVDWWVYPVVFMFISWLLKIFSKAKEGEPKVQPPRNDPRRDPRREQARPARDDKLQSEIDRFLKEVNKTNADVRDPEPARPVVVEAPRKPLTERIPMPVSKAPVEMPAPLRPEPVGSGLATRARPGSGDLGTALRTHLQENVGGDRLRKQVEQDMRPALGASVREHLGQFGAGVDMPNTSTLSTPTDTAASVIALFQNRRGVQQAIIVNEILSRPKSFNSLGRSGNRTRSM